MRGIADLVQSSDELIHLVLLQANTQVHFMVSRSRTVELPTIRDLSPLMLDEKIIPPFHERLCDGELGNTQYEGG